MRTVVNIGSIFLKDSATSSAIISLTEENLTPTSQALAAQQSSPTPPIASSEKVRSIQTSLATLGYKPGPADGILGHQTRNAIEAFQRDRGLPVTGEASARLDLKLSN
jgi:peptidoglycan hydrolase-like protein with peptidoglycan-binding domain